MLRLVVAGSALAGVATVGLGMAPFAVPSAYAALGAGGEYHPVLPTRVLDTRIAASQATGTKGFGDANAFNVKLIGATGIGNPTVVIPNADVLAVVANISVTGADRGGYLTAYPSNITRPDASNVNFKAGESVPNLAILRPGTDGNVRIALNGDSAGSGGSAHVLIDVVGWFSTSTSNDRGSRLVSLAPGRILDTRSGAGRSGALGEGQSFKLKIRGADAVGPARPGYIPNDPNVVGVVLNLTATGPTANTFVSVQPDDFVGFPTTSSLNLTAAQTKANLIMVPVGADGVGYFKAGVNDETRSGRVVPLDRPFRAFDTRLAAYGAAKLGSGQEETWNFNAFIQSVKVGGVWVGEQDSLIMNLTATDLGFPYPVARSDSFITLHPSGTPLPDSSNLNFLPGQSVPNLAVTRLSADNKLLAYNDNGFVHYIGDVAAVVLEDA
jgi:hypothetical protein